jgi:DNA-binding cell septation regulator SpoVG
MLHTCAWVSLILILLLGWEPRPPKWVKDPKTGEWLRNENIDVREPESHGTPVLKPELPRERTSGPDHRPHPQDPGGRPAPGKQPRNLGQPRAFYGTPTQTLPEFEKSDKDLALETLDHETDIRDMVLHTLDNFYIALESPSELEINPSFAKALSKYAVTQIDKIIPFVGSGAEVEKQTRAQIGPVLGALLTEQARADNAKLRLKLGDFVIDQKQHLSNQITALRNCRSVINSNDGDFATDCKDLRGFLRHEALVAWHQDSHQRSHRTTEQTLRDISAMWVRSEGGHLTVTVDENLKVKSAVLLAQKGSQIARRLQRNEVGGFDATQLPIERHIRKESSDGVIKGWVIMDPEGSLRVEQRWGAWGSKPLEDQIRKEGRDFMRKIKNMTGRDP